MAQILECGRCRIAARNPNEVNVADRAVDDSIANRLVRRVEAPVEPDLEEHSLRIKCGERPVHLGEIE